jgi:murein DD-endopeptidase MepM/ murein hydrolase activator NlpD
VSRSAPHAPILRAVVPALMLLVVLVGPVLAAPGPAGPALSGPAPSGRLPLATFATVSGSVRIASALHELAEELRPVSYRPPVDGAVVRPFEPPITDYGPGHRGVDLAAMPGTAVRAAERGRVHHAGAVAGVVWVSIDHRDGIRTSYGPLTSLRVRAGDEVERGAVIGLLAAGDHGQPDVDHGLHLGARRGDVYIDPMLLPGLSGPRATLIGEGGWWGAEHAVTPYGGWAGGRMGGVLTAPSPRATAPGFAVPPNPNHLLLVAGLSSTSGVELLDPAHLGLADGRASRFSYAGADLPYGVEHTWEGIAVASRRLEAQLRQRALDEPGRAVDLVGHSLGGLVIAHYLLHLHDPFDRTLPPIGHVVTIASPLEGSDLARTGLALLGVPGAGRALHGAWETAGGLPGIVGETARSLSPDAPSLTDVATGSEALRELALAWDEARALGSAGPLATGTRVLSIVASLDLLVGADRASLEDADRRVLPGTHDGVLASEAIREVIWHFLAGREVVQSPGHLASVAGGLYGTALTIMSAVVGDRAAALDLPLPPLPLSPIPPLPPAP